MPTASIRLLEALGQRGGESLALGRATLGAVPGGAAIGKLGPLFPKVEAVETA
jgi:hypothetical protein